MRNTNSTIGDAFETIKRIKGLCAIIKVKNYWFTCPWGFGNPYGMTGTLRYYNNGQSDWLMKELTSLHYQTPSALLLLTKLKALYTNLSVQFPKTEFGVHLHSTPDTWREKVEAAYQSGCKRFDSALKGYGGCPMAKDDLTGNIATENLISYLKSQNALTGLIMANYRKR
jgi:hydroxymethylglutaryl-CoA lyase